MKRAYIMLKIDAKTRKPVCWAILTESNPTIVLAEYRWQLVACLFGDTLEEAYRRAERFAATERKLRGVRREGTPPRQWEAGGRS